MSKRGNGEGTISKRSNGTYMGQVTIGRRPDGKPNRKTIYGKTRKEVADKIAAILTDLQKGLPITTSDKFTVGDYLRRWLEDSARPSVRFRTFESYQQIVTQHLIPALGSIPLGKLSPADIQQMYAAKLRTGKSATTVGHFHAVLHRALDQAAKWGLVARNVATLVDRPRQARHEIHPWTPDEARAFLDEARGTRFEALFVLALTTGMRQGELLGLRWQDIDFEAGRLAVRQTLDSHGGKLTFGETKTHRSQRGIALTALALAVLKEHRIRQAEERLVVGSAWRARDLVFCTRLGTPMEANNLVNREFKPLVREAGVPAIRFHDLRHSAATLLLSQNIHPKKVQELLGHSQIGITMDTYSHVLRGTHDEAADAMDRLLGVG